VTNASADFAQFGFRPIGGGLWEFGPLDQVLETSIDGADTRVIGLWPGVYGLSVPALAGCW
jgi:hypothetical protein